MANPEHVDILEQGVEVWNKWRQEHPDIIPDLSEAILAEADLRSVYIWRDDFRKDELGGVILGKTYIAVANLVRANLMESTLTGANLAEADLRQANLMKAYLVGANLMEANLREANFSSAVVGHTIFGNLDLSTVKELETVNHQGPSSIGIDTIYRSGGNIPEYFLRGAGVPETFIAYARSLVNNPIEYYTCFISYSSKDQAFAERLYADLQNNNVRCWYAPEDLKIGDHYHQRIDESIRLYDKLVLILSEQAVQSAWVEREVVAAREKEDREQRPVLFPLCLDDAVMHTTKAWAADVRRRWHIGDFTQWKHHDVYQQKFERLLRDLQAKK